MVCCNKGGERVGKPKTRSVRDPGRNSGQDIRSENDDVSARRVARRFSIVVFNDENGP
jgi:hypothetical protein